MPAKRFRPLGDDPPPLPPIPRPRCPVCKRTRADILKPLDGECLRLDGDDDKTYAVMECNYTALQRVHTELQQRETELLTTMQTQTANAIASMVETTKHSGFDTGLKAFLGKAIRNGVWRKRLGS
jgi:hypothetical protein